MSRETTAPTTPEVRPSSRETAWLAFQFWTGSEDHTWFQAAYLGHWPSRADFGLQLAHDLGADARLQRLPPWLQRYVQLDGDQITRDFETAGHFFFADLPEGDGCHVFDCDA